ncbi:MAG: hypothetical protein AAF039_07300 [Bacteroidota bacterium]
MTFRLIAFLFFTCAVGAQSDALLEKGIFQVDTLSDSKFKEFMTDVTLNNQFILIGEQHGIKEVGTFTNAIFNLVHKDGFNTLCIETDALAAKKIQEIASSKAPIPAAKALSQKFPLSIPFYNNATDYELFTNVVANGGQIWGIDQTFMAQFRLNFDYLEQFTNSGPLKEKLVPLKQKAITAYEESMATKDFSKMFWRSYDEAIHKELLVLSTNPQEQEILHQLWKTKEIYGYNSSKQYYKNNNVRGQLMKANFNAYYKEALKQNEVPKAIFKLGATHATRGLSMTNIYDISNYVAELAAFENKKSLHFMVAGVTGTAMVGNPFAENPIAPFDNTKQLPKELQELLPLFNKKYTLIHLATLRESAYGKKYSEAMKTFIFNFDILVLVKNAEALEGF